MEASRRAGCAVIGNYRVVAHGGSRERSRKRANKNASTLASDMRRSFSGGEFIKITDLFAIIRNNSLRERVKKLRKSREKSSSACCLERFLDPIFSRIDSRTPTPLRMRETNTHGSRRRRRAEADRFFAFDANIFALYPGRER